MAGRELEVDAELSLYQETGGYPLFVVEMVRANLGRVSDSSSETEDEDYMQSQASLGAAQVLPLRVYAVLIGRLQQLSASARSLVELAAVIGREFTLDLLLAVSNTDADSAVRALDELWYKRIVREQGATVMTLPMISCAR